MHITAEQINNVTLKPVMTNAICNGLGFMAEDRLVLLVEAQSTRTENIVVRSFLYLAQTYQDYLQDRNHPQSVYGTKKISISRPEFYIIYTGESPKRKKILSSDFPCIAQNEEILFFDRTGYLKYNGKHYGSFVSAF